MLGHGTSFGILHLVSLLLAFFDLHLSLIAAIFRGPDNREG